MGWRWSERKAKGFQHKFKIKGERLESRNQKKKEEKVQAIWEAYSLTVLWKIKDQRKAIRNRKISWVSQVLKKRMKSKLIKKQRLMWSNYSETIRYWWKRIICQTHFPINCLMSKSKINRRAFIRTKTKFKIPRKANRSAILSTQLLSKKHRAFEKRSLLKELLDQPIRKTLANLLNQQTWTISLH